MKYEIRLTNVPDGAYTEDYLGADRGCSSKAEARRIIAQFNRAMSGKHYTHASDQRGSAAPQVPSVCRTTGAYCCCRAVPNTVVSHFCPAVFTA